MPKKIFVLLLSVLLLLLPSCSTTPPDVPVCVEVTPDRGRCVKIISSEEFLVDETRKFEGKSWWEMRPAMVQVPASSWAAIKAFIIKTCKKTGTCEKEVASWDRTVKTIDGNLEKKVHQKKD